MEQFAAEETRRAAVVRMNRCAAHLVGEQDRLQASHEQMRQLNRSRFVVLHLNLIVLIQEARRLQFVDQHGLNDERHQLVDMQDGRRRRVAKEFHVDVAQGTHEQQIIMVDGVDLRRLAVAQRLQECLHARLSILVWTRSEPELLDRVFQGRWLARHLGQIRAVLAAVDLLAHDGLVIEQDRVEILAYRTVEFADVGNRIAHFRFDGDGKGELTLEFQR